MIFTNLNINQVVAFNKLIRVLRRLKVIGELHRSTVLHNELDIHNYNEAVYSIQYESYCDYSEKLIEIEEILEGLWQH